MKPKKTIKLLFIFTFCFTVNQSSQAQFWKKLKERVEKTVEETVSRKIEKKAEEKTEETIDNVFEKKEKKQKTSKKKTSSKNKEQIDMSGMMEGIMNSGNAKIESKYVFPITATLFVENYKGKETSNTMKQSYGKDAILSVVDASPAPIINDFKNNSAIILDIKKNTAQVMSLAWMQKMMGGNTDDDNANEKGKVTKTGKTKQMNGYTCHEYNIVYEDVKMNAWFAPNVNFSYQDYLRGFAKMFAGKKTANPVALLNDGYGYVMEMTAYQKGKKMSYMKVTELSEKQKVIDLANYKIEKMF